MSTKARTNFDFMGKAKLAIVISILLSIFSVYQWIALGDSKYGIDFKGGHELIVRFAEDTDAVSVKNALESAGASDLVVQAFEDANNEFSVRTPTISTAADQETLKQLRSALNSSFSGKYEELAANYVGPTIGSELKKKATLAFALGLLVLLIYITFRFELAFALGAVAAVFHDVIVCFGIYFFFGYNLTMGSLAAILTIVGYSVNDTIVVFDRMREEMAKRKDFDVWNLMNECLNLTLSRTIITSALTFVSALALFLIGGGAIKDLSFFLMIGLISGTYSTIFIASPIAYFWDKYRNPIAAEPAADSSK